MQSPDAWTLRVSGDLPESVGTYACSTYTVSVIPVAFQGPPASGPAAGPETGIVGRRLRAARTTVLIQYITDQKSQKCRSLIIVPNPKSIPQHFNIISSLRRLPCLRTVMTVIAGQVKHMNNRRTTVRAQTRKRSIVRPNSSLVARTTLVDTRLTEGAR